VDAMFDPFHPDALNSGLMAPMAQGIVCCRVECWSVGCKAATSCPTTSKSMLIAVPSLAC